MWFLSCLLRQATRERGIFRCYLLIPHGLFLEALGFNREQLSLESITIVLAVLRKAFNSFDREKSGSIPTDMVADILRLMGQPFNKKILDELIEEVDADSK